MFRAPLGTSSPGQIQGKSIPPSPRLRRGRGGIDFRGICPGELVPRGARNTKKGLGTLNTRPGVPRVRYRFDLSTRWIPTVCVRAGGGPGTGLGTPCWDPGTGPGDPRFRPGKPGTGWGGAFSSPRGHSWWQLGWATPGFVLSVPSPFLVFRAPLGTSSPRQIPGKSIPPRPRRRRGRGEIDFPWI